jgi:hypothetical protein
MRTGSMSCSNTNRGQIWSNERKKKETHPDFKGSVNVKGEEYWITAWKQKGGANPDKLNLSFSVQPKDETTIQQAKDYVVKTDNQPGDRV